MALISTPAATAAHVTPELVRARLEGRQRDIAGVVFRLAVLLALLFALTVLGVLLVDIIRGGSGVLRERFSDFMNGRLSSLPGQAGVAQGLYGPSTSRSTRRRAVSPDSSTSTSATSRACPRSSTGSSASRSS
jgi:hypothetical protein